MIGKHMITHGLIYAAISTIYLFVTMILTSPRVWGYSDYPEEIKNKVPPQTKDEKTLATILGVVYILIELLLPVLSTYWLKSKLGGEISFLTAFLNVFVLMALANLADLFILDWLIVSKITPGFVIIPGTEAQDYKDFSHHYKAHARFFPFIILACVIMALVVWRF